VTSEGSDRGSWEGESEASFRQSTRRSDDADDDIVILCGDIATIGSIAGPVVTITAIPPYGSFSYGSDAATVRECAEQVDTSDDSQKKPSKLKD
jgi:hypothetical protein